MKHFVSAALLAVLAMLTGCIGNRPATSPYYTSYYSVYDAYNNCYYHPGYYGYGGGVYGRNRWNSGGKHEHHDGGGGREHHGGGHHGGGGGGHHGGGGHGHH